VNHSADCNTLHVTDRHTWPTVHVNSNIKW